jgi:orotidine-5'-phosphate decarboxylase
MPGDVPHTNAAAAQADNRRIEVRIMVLSGSLGQGQSVQARA